MLVADQRFYIKKQKLHQKESRYRDVINYYYCLSHINSNPIPHIKAQTRHNQNEDNYLLR